MKTIIRALWRDTAAATSIEYAVIGSIISIGIVLGATAIGTKLNANILPISTNLN